MAEGRTLAAAVDARTLKDPRITTIRVAMRKRSSQPRMEMDMVAGVAAEIVDEALEVAATKTAGVAMVRTSEAVETTIEVAKAAEEVATTAEEVATTVEEVETTDAVVVTTDAVAAMAATMVAAEVVAVMADVVAEAVATADKVPPTTLGHTIHLVTIRA